MAYLFTCVFRVKAVVYTSVYNQYLQTTVSAGTKRWFISLKLIPENNLITILRYVVILMSCDYNSNVHSHDIGIQERQRKDYMSKLVRNINPNPALLFLGRSLLWLWIPHLISELLVGKLMYKYIETNKIALRAL